MTNLDFTKTLGAALHRPTIFQAPAFALRLALGSGAANEMLLASQRVEPARLVASGYPFQFKDLTQALRDIIGR